MRSPVRILVSLLIAGALLVFLFRWGDVSLGELVECWRTLPLVVYFQALGVHFGIYLLRAARFRVLLPPKRRPSLFVLLAVSSSHNLASYVLPAKTGEGTLVLYLRNLCAVPAGEGLASLVVSRLLDLATLTALLAVASLMLAADGTLPGSWGWPLGACLALGAATLFVLASRSEGLIKILTLLARLLRFDGTRLGAKLSASAERVGSALREAGGQGRLAAAAALSLPLWLGVFAFYIVLARGFGLGVDVGAVKATFASSWAVLANLLPINGFAGAGTQEFGWVVGFSTVGVDEALALSSGLGVHIVQLANVVLFGLFGHVAMAIIGPGSSAPSASEGEA